jgi:hypothetical protein
MNSANHSLDPIVLQKRIAALEAAVTQCRTLSAMLKPQADRIAELEAEVKMWRNEDKKKQTACEQMGSRIAELEAALRNIEADCCSDCHRLYMEQSITLAETR